jgi:hypothetical protein
MSEALNLETLETTSYRTDDIVLVDVAAATVDDQDPWDEIALPDAVAAQDLEESDSIDLVDSLTCQNQTLRDRVDFLESALGQSQLSHQQAMERWESQVRASEDARLREQEAVIGQHVEHLNQAQKKVGDLYGELELSHQLTQRQQILIETLNTELRLSLEQVALLERECALTQQRYGEQVQLVSLGEHSCRDLRARLHRQQRYTLQFKAALEKSLEVPTAAAVVEPVEEPRANPIARVAIPKATPVQPWSAAAVEGGNELSSVAWVNSFMSDSEAFPNDEAKTVYLTEEELGEDLGPVSYVIEESEFSEEPSNLDLPSPRLDGWEMEAVDEVKEPVAAVSPFITLKSLAEEDCERMKREDLLGIELPSFGR